MSRKKYSRKHNPTLSSKLISFIFSSESYKYMAIGLYGLFVLVILDRTSKGNVSLIEWLLVCVIPIGYWYWKSQKRQRMIKNRSLAYVLALELIKTFRPSQHYDNEIHYHRELFAYLNRNMPYSSLDMEQQRGSSRPDIVVDHEISIEVKRPTGPEALASLGDKCVRYSTRFEHVIIVCFAVFARENRYEEVDKGIKRQFPNIVMVRIDKDKQGRIRKYHKHVAINNPPQVQNQQVKIQKDSPYSNPFL